MPQLTPPYRRAGRAELHAGCVHWHSACARVRRMPADGRTRLCAGTDADGRAGSQRLGPSLPEQCCVPCSRVPAAASQQRQCATNKQRLPAHVVAQAAGSAIVGLHHAGGCHVHGRQPRHCAHHLCHDGQRSSPQRGAPPARSGILQVGHAAAIAWLPGAGQCPQLRGCCLCADLTGRCRPPLPAGALSVRLQPPSGAPECLGWALCWGQPASLCLVCNQAGGWCCLQAALQQRGYPDINVTVLGLQASFVPQAKSADGVPVLGGGRPPLVIALSVVIPVLVASILALALALWLTRRRRRGWRAFQRKRNLLDTNQSLGSQGGYTRCPAPRPASQAAGRTASARDAGAAADVPASLPWASQVLQMAGCLWRLQSPGGPCVCDQAGGCTLVSGPGAPLQAQRHDGGACRHAGHRPQHRPGHRPQHRPDRHSRRC